MRRRSQGSGHTSLLVDTNLLVLYIVGSLDPDLIRRHKRTSQFTVEDYRLLDAYLRRFKRIVTTPNVLTEVSNLLSQIGGGFATRLRILLRALVVELFREEYVASTEAVGAEEFQRLGLTDAAILLLPQQDLLVLTDDIHLFLALQNRGVDTVNFNHLREAAWRQ